MNYQTAFIPGSLPDGQPIISVLAKRTYTIAPGTVEEADEQLEICTEDTYADPDSPMYSEVIAETELLFYKPSTDVIVMGKAYAPRGKEAYHLECEVNAGPMSKAIRVFGDRTARLKTFGGVAISDPAPFAEMEIGYTKSYGGSCRNKNGTIVSYYPNPIGSGFTLKGGLGDVETFPVPNIEDPQSPVTEDCLLLGKFDEWENCPKPVSFGWTRRNFYPRYTYLGVLPEFLEAAFKNRDIAARQHPQVANVEIPKMDFRAFQGASDGLWGKRLQGNERISLKYLDPDYPTFEFDLPAEVPTISLDIGDGPKTLEPELDTLVIKKDENVMTLVWRGCMEYGGIEELGMVKKLVISAE